MKEKLLKLIPPGLSLVVLETKLTVKKTTYSSNKQNQLYVVILQNPILNILVKSARSHL